MSLQSDMNRYAGVAVFCRNHKNFLDEAVEISCRNPLRLITFRAKTIWRTAETILNALRPRPIYFLPVDDPDACIKYVAQLERVALRPTDTAATRQELEDQSVPSARDEKLWPDERGRPSVRTLYSISHCRELAKEQWLPFTALRKLSNGECLDAKFGYSYAIVYAHSALSHVLNGENAM